jgi:TonB family protein
MGKIVKYCSVCEEGFAEKSSFCPKCAASLTAYEMKPVMLEKVQASDSIEIKQKSVNDSVNDLQSEFNPLSSQKYNDGVYHIAIVENTNNSVRNSILLGSFILVIFGTFAGVIISIFNTSLNIGSINDDNVIAYMLPQNPDVIDEPQQPKAKKKDAGGGGGGGDHDLNQASKGREAMMMENPLIAPSVKNDPVTNPDIKLQPAVKGPQTEYKEDKTQPYGIKNSIYTIPSDAPGSEGGQGSGSNRGQGPGFGPGIGPGSNGGRNGGDKGGIGPDSGPGIAGRDDEDKDSPPEAKKVTIALKIISKPKALYTDSARQNAVQGAVTLRVIFLANGSVGNITTVSGLPNGLTEQAIAAARSIKFEPQKINGVAQSVTKQIQYTFTLF